MDDITANCERPLNDFVLEIITSEEEMEPDVAASSARGNVVGVSGDAFVKLKVKVVTAVADADQESTVTFEPQTSPRSLLCIHMLFFIRVE